MGLKDVADDFAVVVSAVPAASAAVFTKSRFAGPSVLLSRADAARQDARGMVVISRNANVATGKEVPRTPKKCGGWSPIGSGWRRSNW